MVHIKRVELSHFKSFGSTTQIPLLTGFTVVSGPNGSGKSNILDALLFALGISSSKGMRAERLPDLVSHAHQSNSRAETSVTVTFDLGQELAAEEPRSPGAEGPRSPGPEEDAETLEYGDAGTVQNSHSPHSSLLTPHSSHQEESDFPNPQSQEWSVTRRLRVTKEGKYSSTYYINGESCTLTELHEQLNRLRIYPEGYNVVLQGDVTRIITMNPRERREIIDELAGVADFDRKIARAKETLEEVKEREERCQVLEQELVRERDRLAADRSKAEKYQKLKAEIEQKQQWEAVLIWRSLQEQEYKLQEEIAAGEAEETQLSEKLASLATEISEASTHLEQLNARVKSLGEDEQLSVNSKLATQQAQQQQLQQRQQELDASAQATEAAIEKTHHEIEQHRYGLEQIKQEKEQIETQALPSLQLDYNQAQQALEKSREEANMIASASQTWVQQHTALTRQIASLQQTLNPQRTEQAQLQERQSQLQTKSSELTQLLEQIKPDITNKQAEASQLESQVTASEQQVQSLAQKLTEAEQKQQNQQDTQTRLLKEQREKQRQLDKLEATNQAQQEAQGTYATQVLLQADLPGVCGLVAQLAQVESRYQLALETSAGGRLGQIVVEDDSVAAAGIELLKQKRAGRATFLPLNKIPSPRLSATNALRYAQGFIDYAVNLIECEPRYDNIFAYVFGNTAVFATLDDARSHLGKNRIVTLQGELLESSGAMSGGSQTKRSSLHFGTATTSESSEIEALKPRLQEIEQVLAGCEEKIHQASEEITQTTQALSEARQQHQEKQWQAQQLQQEIQRLVTEQEQTHSSAAQNHQELDTVQNRLQVLAEEIPTQETELEQQQQRLAQLEDSHTHQRWQQIQTLIQEQETQLQECEKALRSKQQQLQDLENQRLRLEEKIQTSGQRLEEYQQQQESIRNSQFAIRNQQSEIKEQIAETQAILNQLSEQLGEAKQERNQADEKLRSLQLSQQQYTWQQQKLAETQQERRDSHQTLQQKRQAQEQELTASGWEIASLQAEEDKGTRGQGDAESRGAPGAGSRGETNALGNYFPSAPPHLGTSAQNTSSLLTPDSSLPIATQLEQLQKELRDAQKRLQAMEPVNMLALEEYERTQARLQELSEKLTTLEAERTELLLRIENFTTKRLQAFQEAFDAVNQNFQTIFATLSDGDGYLQFDDPEDPSKSGLNLVAHPKGKPVQRLHSMSGGEKSLTALSFIFALQRYRPSPFYAFDEVDMFLDGANVERLATMIKQQAQQAQFIVVSLRRPMIEAANRTIGVTQARGAHTQVLGIKL